MTRYGTVVTHRPHYGTACEVNMVRWWYGSGTVGGTGGRNRERRARLTPTRSKFR